MALVCVGSMLGAVIGLVAGACAVLGDALAEGRRLRELDGPPHPLP